MVAAPGDGRGVSAGAHRVALKARRNAGVVAIAVLILFSLLMVGLVVFSSPAAAAPPVVVLRSPVGGEDWTGGSTHNIVWSVSDSGVPPVAYWINDSANNGSSWSFITNGSVAADGSNRSFSWLTPFLNTASMRVRVCARDNTTTVCTASSAFRIDSTLPVASPWPASGAGSVARTAPVSLNFSEAMQTPALALSAVTFLPAVTVLSLMWTTPFQLIVAHAAFAPSTNYTWYLACSIRDASNPGNAVVGCGSPLWRFRTNTPPFVVYLGVDGSSTPPETQRIPNDVTPTFSWGFQDPDANASQKAYEWEILDATNGSVVGASGALYGTANTSMYAGPALLPGSCYVLRVRVFDGVDWSNWATLDFCVAPQPLVVLLPLSLLPLIVPVSITVVLVSALLVFVWPRAYRIAEVTSIAEALVALFIDFSMMIPSLQPLQVNLSPGFVLAAILTAVPVLVHFLPESGGGALDPEPGSKLVSHGVFGSAMIGLGIVFPPAAPIAASSVAADFGLGASIAARLRLRKQLAEQSA